MNKPTEAQAKEFWEGCGLKYEDITDKHIWFTLVYPSGNKETIWRLQPSIDLNNLFKYAVPKLVAIVGRDKSYTIICQTIYKLLWDNFAGSLGDFQSVLALTLFWAIWEVIK